MPYHSVLSGQTRLDIKLTDFVNLHKLSNATTEKMLKFSKMLDNK